MHWHPKSSIGTPTAEWTRLEGVSKTRTSAGSTSGTKVPHSTHSQNVRSVRNTVLEVLDQWRFGWRKNIFRMGDGSCFLIIYNIMFLDSSGLRTITLPWFRPVSFETVSLPTCLVRLVRRRPSTKSSEDQSVRRMRFWGCRLRHPASMMSDVSS